MSTASVLPIPQGRYVFDLQAQHRTFSSAAPRRLVVSCDESDPSAEGAWLGELGPVLHLRCPGASPDGLGVREAIEYAVLELGIREIVWMLHSRCGHVLDESVDEARRRERALPFMERLYSARERGERQLHAARGRIREIVRAMQSDPLLGSADPIGLVHIVESGVVLRYDPASDDFEALL